ncbi:D7 protein, partial [Chloropsis cyanopogon]|nr:D7 protein [Chloropsis cyanopogon]
MEPDALVQCPYDRSHQVRVSRLPYHLVRCQQSPTMSPRCPPGVPTGWHIPTVSPRCPHRVPIVSPSCPHRVPTVSPRCPPVSPRCPRGVPTVSPRCPRCPRAELGELELEEPPPFILHVTKGDLPVPCH